MAHRPKRRSFSRSSRAAGSGLLMRISRRIRPRSTRTACNGSGCSAMRANSFTIILVLALLALGAGGYWVYQHVERYEEPAAARYSRKALRDPFLAADYLLRELGTVPARDPLLKQLDKLPPQGSVILTTPSNLITEKQAAALTRWLRKDGHLLVIAGSDSDVHADPLLAPYGIRRDFKFVFGNDSGDDSNKAEKLSEQLREINRKIQSGKKIEDIAEDERAD